MHIDVYSDLICPWCFIGKRRLDQVLATPVGRDVWVRWRPFQLYPQMPAEGVDRKTFMRARFGDAAAANTGTPARIAAEAEGLGIAFDYDAISRVPNTFNGHRLVEWIGPGEAQHALVETLFSYYFCEGRDLGDLAVLADAAERVGVDRDRALAMLRSDVGVDDLRIRVREAYDAGVTGVPCFVLPSGYGIPGAQPPEVLARIIEKAREQLAEEPTT